MKYNNKNPRFFKVATLAAAIFLASCSNSSNDSTPNQTNDPVEPIFNRNLFDDTSSLVDNSYFPLKPGTTVILEGQNDEGDIERVVTNVSHETRLVDGVESVIVVDREYEDGELAEETFDWYAQDIQGNVWYMGEASTGYEDGIAVDTDGSWESGVDVENNGQVGQAGIVMKANPVVGDTYQHEIYPGVAEDAAEIVSLAAPFTYADGQTVTALQVRETNPLEPVGSAEFKYYLAGEGLIAEENTDGSERVELIDRLDQANPQIDPASFANSLTIDNRWLPLIVGSVRMYEVDTEDGLETITIEVLDETRDVMGVTTRVVRDQVFLEGVVIEDTRDWFAQDTAGNVWYFGEEVDNYEYDDEGNLLEVNNDSAWEAGIDGAQPGIIMLSDPRVGDSYRQEYGRGEAEDLGSVVGINVEVVLEDGRTYNTLKTRDWNPLEPDAGDEFKYYADGFGLVKEEGVEDDETLELVN